MAYKSGEYSVTTRRIKLFDFLRGKRFPILLVELMSEFDMSDDAIRRDLAFLAEAGYAIDFIREDSKAGRTMVRMRSPSFIDVPITRDEAHTFAGSRRLWAPLKGTAFYDDFENIYRKVVETLPPKERADIERDCAHFFCIPDGGVLTYEEKRGVVDALRLGTVARRRVKFDYRTRAGKRRSGLMEPFAIGVHKNTVYVLARLVPSKRAVTAGVPPYLEWVSWPAHRFVEVKLTRSEFEVPSDFKLEDHFDGWGIISGDERERVVVEFDAEVAPLIAERRWHASQTLEALPAGGLRLTCEIANTSEVIAWILSYGSHAVVIEPESLRMEILREFTKGMERMLARVPTGPDPPRGWQDESERVFGPKQMQKMRMSVSNENSSPPGDDPDGDRKTKIESSAVEDEEDAEENDWADVTETDPESPVWNKRSARR
jgi:predicted DNA-binding transcriptional regulator YafY